MDLFRSPSPSLLHGVRVLSFGSFVAGNICALMLGELGADVVKVEARDRPEALRSYDSPDQAEVFEPSGIRTTALFAGLTRSMRSVCIDMTGESGRGVFRALAGQADVVVENLGPGTMEKWGCSFAELRAGNPRLVMLSISGYGRSGPLADFRAYASNINNYLGLTAAWAPDGIHFDFVAGIHGAAAVVAALARVDQGAPGVFVDMAQTEAGAGIMAPLYLDFLANGHEWTAAPNEVPGSLFSAAVKCRGTDEWLAIELEDARDWDIMCDVLGSADLKIRDGAVTPERRESLRQGIDGWAGTLTPFQAAHRLQAVGVAAGPVQNSEDLWRDIQFRSRGSFVEVYHPDIGTVEYPGSPARLSGTPGRVKCRGPRLGEHTRPVLREWLGKEDGDMARLIDSGAIWQFDES
jgi:crotonobetainyl-CoA:carnitine CoA-transferase CaiB-like acyl-CoA transferase